MKVRDLIKKLKEFDQEAVVITPSSNFELNNADVEVSSVNEYKDGKKEIRHFTDAFDYGEYSKEIWSISGGRIPVVYIS